MVVAQTTAGQMVDMAEAKQTLESIGALIDRWEDRPMVTRPHPYPPSSFLTQPPEPAGLVGLPPLPSLPPLPLPAAGPAGPAEPAEPAGPAGPAYALGLSRVPFDYKTLLGFTPPIQPRLPSLPANLVAAAHRTRQHGSRAGKAPAGKAPAGKAPAAAGKARQKKRATTPDVVEVAAPGSTPANMLCLFCRTNRREYALMPCKHLAVCAKCRQTCTNCPACGVKIRSRIQIIVV